MLSNKTYFYILELERSRTADLHFLLIGQLIWKDISSLSRQMFTNYICLDTEEISSKLID